MKDHFNGIEEDFSKFASLLFERLHALEAALSEGKHHAGDVSWAP
jgi:hypothetical protein